MRSLLLLLLFPACASAQDYKWGGTDKYRKADSLFVEWEHSLTKIYPDSPKIWICEVIMDSVLKIKKERNIQGHIYFKEKDNARNEKLMEEMKPEIDKMVDADKKDTSRPKRGRMMMIPAPPPKDLEN